MRAGVLVLGAVTVILGEVGAALLQNQVADYEKFASQTDEVLSLTDNSSIFRLLEITPILNLLKYSPIFVGITGIALLIYGTLAKNKPKEYCKHCGAHLPHKHMTHNNQDGTA